MDKANFVYLLIKFYTIYEYKKFEINKMNHHFVFKQRKIYISNIKNIKSRLKNMNNSTFNVLNEKYLNKLDPKVYFQIIFLINQLVI